MGRIPDDIIQDIRDRVDVVDLVGRHVTLRQAGRNWKGLCPFHDEKTPSFNVSPDRQIFHCFGCGAGGDVFGFLMRHENLSFPEAARALAAEAGIAIPEQAGGEAGISERLVAANGVAQRLYRDGLERSEAARDYLRGRGIDAETAERFGIGFAPDSWDALLRALAAERISGELGAKAGLLAERRSGSGHYDRLRGRVTFPVHDARGRVIGFGGRALGPDQEPKYLNTPESPLFRKREALYGIERAREAMRRTGRAVVVEGYFDCIALHRAGVEEAVATCGTSLTPEHARELRRRTGAVVLLFDGDAAGHKAMLRALEALLPHGLRVAAAELPAGSDPDDVLRAEGPEALRALVEAAQPALVRAMDEAARRHGSEAPEAQAAAVAEIAPLIARIPDGVERDGFAERLALVTRSAPGRIRDQVESLARRPAAGADEAYERVAATLQPRRTGPEERHLRTLVRIALDQPAVAAEADAGELAELAEGTAWAAVLEPLWAALPEGVSTAALSERLPPAGRAGLHALAAEDLPPFDAESARRALSDTLAWLRRRREREHREAVTRELRLAASAGQQQELLREKHRQIERRRAVQKSP